LLDGTKQSGEKFKYFDETKDLGILEDVKRYLQTIY
jgi:ATP-dependent DNA helicase RecG